MRRFDFDGLRLVEALKRTFEHRKTSLPAARPLLAEEIYDEKSDRQMLWKTFLIKGHIKHAPEKLSVTAKAIEEFLIKPLESIDRSKKFSHKWVCVPGQWR